MRLRYHCRPANGSFGVNVGRRDARIALDPGDAVHGSERACETRVGTDSANGPILDTG